MTIDVLLALVARFVDSFQVRAVFGLIILDVLLGVASAIRSGAFDFAQLANFYRTNVVPYMLGYGAFYVVTYAVFPKDFAALPDGIVTLAWGALVGNLVKSILANTGELFEVKPKLAPLAPLVLLPFLLAATATVANADTDSSPAFADTFPQAEEYCLAAAVHTEAARQSPEAKAAIARWILVRAIERQQTVCQSLRSERTVLAAHAKPGSWAWYVFHHGDLLQRQRGAESWLIALDVYDAAAMGGEIYAHWDSCDTRAAWAAFYERVRFVETDAMCFWK